MPPRHKYWTIIVDGKPTAFRAHSTEELLPTLRQLAGKHPDAVLRWFARGRLWESPEQERAEAGRRGDRERRGPGWRPGGTHRDPRERFNVPRDEKRRRFAAKLRRERDEREPGRGPHGERERRPRPDWKAGRPPEQRPQGQRDWRPHRPDSDRPGRPPDWRRERPEGRSADFRRGRPFGDTPSRGPEEGGRKGMDRRPGGWRHGGRTKPIGPGGHGAGGPGGRRPRGPGGGGWRGGPGSGGGGRGRGGGGRGGRGGPSR